MIRVTAALASSALIGALAACAPPPGAHPAAPAGMTSAAPPPAQLAGRQGGGASIDGVYRPPPGGVSGNSACRTTRFDSPIRVVNGVATMQTASQGRLEGPVAPDGSLLIQHGRASLQGQFSGNQFNGTFSVGRCGFAMTYVK